jgi:hypothetical protein
LNLDTLSIPPHVVFDYWFTTMNSKTIDDPVDPICSEHFADCRFHYQFDEDDDIILDPQWNAPSPPTITHDSDQPQTIQTLPSIDSPSRSQQPSPISPLSSTANNTSSISIPSDPTLPSSPTPTISHYYSIQYNSCLQCCSNTFRFTTVFRPFRLAIQASFSNTSSISTPTSCTNPIWL